MRMLVLVFQTLLPQVIQPQEEAAKIAITRFVASAREAREPPKPVGARPPGLGPGDVGFGSSRRVKQG